MGPASPSDLRATENKRSSFWFSSWGRGDRGPAYIPFMQLLVCKDFSMCYNPYWRSQSGNLGAEHSTCKYFVCRHNGFFKNWVTSFPDQVWNLLSCHHPTNSDQFWLSQASVTLMSPPWPLNNTLFANPILYIQRKKWQNNSSPQKLYPLLYINPRNWWC